MGEYEYRLRDRDGYCDEPDGGFDWWQLILIVMIALMMLGLFAGCKSTKYVTVPEYHTEYIVRSDTVAKVDSVTVRDSVFVYHNGDTIVINKVMYRDRVRNVYKTRTDTLLRRDSVNVPYPVEKQLTKAERRYLAVGKYACKALASMLVLAVLLLLAWLGRRYRRQ